MSVDPWIEEAIQDCIKDRMYGSIEIKLEAGKVVLVKLTETLKPPQHKN